MLMLLPTALVEAADVPDFRTVAGNNVQEEIDERVKGRNSNFYSYECDLDLKEDFVNRYVDLLMKKYHFVFIDYHSKEWPLSALRHDTWIFKYVGSKTVASFKNEHDGEIHYCHLRLTKARNFEEGKKYFYLKIANGLTYGGDS